MMETACPCTRGIFEIATDSTLEVRCRQCGRLLSEHQDTQMYYPLTEGSSSVSNSGYAQHASLNVRFWPPITVLLLRDYCLENKRNVFLVGYWESLEHFSGKDLGTDLLRSCVEDTLSTVLWAFSPQTL